MSLGRRPRGGALRTALMMALATAAAAPEPDARLHMPVWLQTANRKKPKKAPRKIGEGARWVTPSTNPRKIAKRIARLHFFAATGRRLSGRQLKKLRKQRECYAGFAIWLIRTATNKPTPGLPKLPLSPQRFSQINQLAIAMAHRTADVPPPSEQAAA